MNIHDSIVQVIGSTPLIRFRHLGRDLGADLVFKMEFSNPLGSVKDRIGRAMIEDAEATGRLKKSMRVVEATSGNTGVALAFICATKGYPITLVMPETMSIERRVLLLLLGADLVLTPASLGMKGAIAKAKEICDNDLRCFAPLQFDNPANPDAHRKTTAIEIWNDTDGQVDMVIAGVGTGGTLTGIGSFLKSKKPNVKMIAVEPLESAVISGEKSGPHKIQGIGAGFIPKNLDMRLIDGIEKVSSDESIAMAKRVIKEEGVPVGISGGAAITAALRQANRPENKGKLIVVILASYTERYLSTSLAQEAREKAQALPTTLVTL